jgi:uncharacterized protein (TIGR02118 family)
MSREAFADYWINDHTPLTANVPGVRSYRCYVVTGDGDPAYDGVAVLAFDDQAAYDQAMASPQFAAAIEDAPNFQNTGLTTSLLAEEHVIV